MLILGWTIIHSIWQGLVAWAMVGTLRYALRRRSPQSRYAIGCAVFFLFPLTAILSGIVSADQMPATVANFAAGGPVTVDREVSAGPIADDRLYYDYRGGVRVLPIRAETMGDRLALAAEPFFPFLVGTWAIGSTFFAVFNLTGIVALSRLASSAVPVRGDLIRRFDALRERMLIGRNVRFLCASRCSSPFTFGWLRPAVLLPLSALTELSVPELEAIIAHELSHIGRHDYVVRQGQAVVESLFFYHPCVWLMSASIAHDREASCDNIAATTGGDFRKYAEVLVKANNLFGSKTADAAMNLNGGSLLDRIRILSHHRRGPRTDANTTLAAVVTCGACVLLIGASAVNGAKEWNERRQRSLQTAEVSVFQCLKLANRRSDSFERTYQAALQAAIEKAQPSDERYERLLTTVTTSGADLDLVWRRYVKLIGPGRYPTTPNEFPADWPFSTTAVHRRLVARLWEHAKSAKSAGARAAETRVAIAIATMRREGSVTAALRSILTDPAFADVSGCTASEIRSLRAYWADANFAAAETRVMVERIAKVVGQPKPDHAEIMSLVRELERRPNHVSESSFLAASLAVQAGVGRQALINAAATKDVVFMAALGEGAVQSGSTNAIVLDQMITHPGRD